MSSPVSISPSGTLRSLLSLGFTLQDALHELIDNAFDAGATAIRIRLSTADSHLYIDDNGRGMNAETLTRCMRIFNTKVASESIGLRGVGVKAGHAVLSDEKAATRIFSKTAHEEDAFEICADWPLCIEKDVWNPIASEVSARRLPIWIDGRLNSDHGTVMAIPMPTTSFTHLLETLPKVLEDIGYTYESHLLGGSSITVQVDGAPARTPILSAGMGWDTTPAHLRTEVPIEVWRNEETGAVRIYYRYISLRPIWTDMVRSNPENPKKKPLRDYGEDDDFVCVGRFVMRSTFNPAWNPAHSEEEGVRAPFTEGYIAFRRHTRALRPLTMEVPQTGDYEKRRVVGASRHTVDFDHTADSLVGVEVNKSAITPGNICAPLLASVKRLAAEWAGKVYESTFKVHSEAEPEDVAFARRLKSMLKSLKLRATGVQRDEFLDTLEEMMSEWDCRDSDDESE